MVNSHVALALALADIASATILPHFRALDAIDNKEDGGFDPVTAADRGAEKAMRNYLAEHAPMDGVLGEEFPSKLSKNGNTWILDPIDGTRGFIMGLPTWGTLIALHTKQTVTIGVMAQPFVNERFLGTEDGAFHLGPGMGPENATPIKSRTCATLADALVATTSPDLFTGKHRQGFERLHSQARQMRYGADCYGYAMVAAGHCDAVVEMGLKPVDIAPFLPLVRAAGGVITDFQGQSIEESLLGDYNGEAVAVGDPRLLEPVLKALNG